jgi:tetratricopeptide (TPR) repeat protein|tara:strand:- start:167 stop:1909 length:1743 start_codon:yes stop_codon:yes gene_type:complete
MNNLSRVTLLLLSFGIASCVATTQAIDDTLKTVSVASNETQSEPIDQQIKPIAIDTLYDLLVGDVALGRNQFKIALDNYSRQARLTADKEVIALAHRIAEYVRDQAVQLEMALLWVDTSPDDPEAHKAALQAYLNQGDALTALTHASWLYQYHNDLDSLLLVTTTFDSPSQIASLIDSVKKLPFSREKQAITHLLTAVLEQKLGQLKDAERNARAFLAAVPADQRGLLLLSQLLHQQNRSDESIELLIDALKDKPNNRPLRLQYARFLATNTPKKAITQFEILRDDNPKDQEVNFLLALMQLSHGDIAAAENLFEQASAKPSLRSDAQYHLGAISEQKGDISGAMSRYTQVRFGRNYIAAASRLSALLAKHRSMSQAQQYLQRMRSSQPTQAVILFQVESNLLLNAQKPSQALVVLSSGLDYFPNDPQLLYARSMVAEQQDDFVLAEQDLRAILAQDQNNATVLNALGYTMILHTDRREEAFELISKAYQLEPKDPSIIDSMGWALFKLGKTEQALDFLKQAFEIMPDPEIAAHLGEVHWTLDNRKDASIIWQQGLQSIPDHKGIINTMLRLSVPESIEQ